MEKDDTSPASPSAVEDISFDAPLPFDPTDDTPEPEHPQFVWVKFDAEQAPDDGLDYRADEGASGIGRVLPRASASREKPPRIQMVRIDLSPDEAYVDQTSGILDKKLFVSLARKRAFPVTAIGRRFVAKLSDVRRFIESHRLDPKGPPPKPEQVGLADELDDVRLLVGLRPKGGR